MFHALPQEVNWNKRPKEFIQDDQHVAHLKSLVSRKNSVTHWHFWEEIVSVFVINSIRVTFVCREDCIRTNSLHWLHHVEPHNRFTPCRVQIIQTLSSVDVNWTSPASQIWSQFQSVDIICFSMIQISYRQPCWPAAATVLCWHMHRLLLVTLQE